MSILQAPGSDGRFGEFGGRYVPETLVPACQELKQRLQMHGMIRYSALTLTNCCANTQVVRA